jgi:hypothetical protein
MISAYAILTKLINDRLQGKLNGKLDRATCMEIYNDIFFSITEVLNESQAPLQNESANLLSQMYYDCVTLQTSAGPMGLDPTIFDKRASMDNIPTKELALLASMVSGSPFAIPIISEVKRRS